MPWLRPSVLHSTSPAVAMQIGVQWQQFLLSQIEGISFSAAMVPSAAVMMAMMPVPNETSLSWKSPPNGYENAKKQLLTLIVLASHQKYHITFLPMR